MRQFLCILLITPQVASAGEFADICQQQQDIEYSVCQCIEDQLATDLGDDDFALYTRVNAAYLSNLDADENMSLGDAWDAAIRAEAKVIGSGFSALLERTNAMGQAYRKISQGCKS